MENDEHSIEEEDKEEEEEEEEEDESPSVVVDPTSVKLAEIIVGNDLLPQELAEENQNRLFKPFHDEAERKSDDEQEETESTTSTSQRLSTLAIDKNYVRSKVKQTLKKKLKQQHHRLCSKGESALVTAQQRDHRDTIHLHLE